MIYKLGMSAEKRWHRIREFLDLVKVIEGVRFRNEVKVNSNADDNRNVACLWLHQV